MSQPALSALIARCRALGQRQPQLPDAELLRRFAQKRDAAAFDQLLNRYAPLVWGVCRRILFENADREDAFQATFLALVRQASSLDARRSLGGWLHTVALRAAHRARSRRPRTGAALPERTTMGDVAEEVSRRELFRAVDEEIARLPATLRIPIILCCLEGRTRDEAAEALGCSLTAIKRRLERGRELLRRRLRRRGVQLPAVFLVLGLTTERIRASLWAKTMQTALYTPAPAVASLAEASISTVTIGKSKLILAALLLATSAAGAVGSLLTAKAPQPPPTESPPAKTAAKSMPRQSPHVRTDRHGDPLPAGASARLGTLRFRHGAGIYAIAFSPNGKTIAVTGHGRALTLWDIATGKETCRFPDRGQPSSVAFSPDGKMLATMDFRKCYLFDAATGKELRPLGEGISPRCITFSPDGKIVAACGRGTVVFWDAASGKELRRLHAKDEWMERIAFSPDSRLLAAAATSGTMYLWKVDEEKEPHQWIGHKSEIIGLAFSPNGKLLASASRDETLRLWDAATGRPVRQLGEKLSKLGAVAFSPGGKRLASGHQDGTIRLWDPAAGREIRRWQGHSCWIYAIAFSPDGQTLASGSALESAVRFWDAATGEERRATEGHRGPVQGLRFSADGRTLCSIGNDRQLLWWDRKSSAILRRFSWLARGPGRFALSADNRTLIAGNDITHELFAWDVSSNKPGRLLGKYPEHLMAAALSPDGRLAATGGIDQKIHIWDVIAGKEIQSIEGAIEGVIRMSFSPDGKRLAAGMRNLSRQANPTLRVWDVSSGKDACRFDCRESSCWTAVFSPDGKVLATGHVYINRNRDYIGYVRLWDATTGKHLCRYEGGPEGVGTIAFSPDGKLIACGFGGAKGEEHCVFHLWEAATGKLIRRFPCHHSGVLSLAFSPDGSTIASGGGDSTILIWDLIDRSSGSVSVQRNWDAHWKALADADAAKAYDVVWRLAAAPEQATPFLRKHLRPVPRPDANTIARLLAELDSDDFAVRRKADEELSKFGDAITPELRKALAGKPSLEVRRRVQLLDQARDWTVERLRDRRAIQVLEYMHTPQARQLLEALAAGAPNTLRTEEAKMALRRWAREAVPDKKS